MTDFKEAVKTACLAIEDKKGYDIKVLNISGLSPMADYFVLASGDNVNQLHAIADEITDKLGEKKIFSKQTEGYNPGNWILMDYGDFIIHLFNKESRDFYNLERIWKDAVLEEY